MNSASSLLEYHLPRWHVTVLMLVALTIRGGLLFLSHDNLSADPDGYRRLAENLVDRGTLADEVPVARQLPDGTAEVTREFWPTAYRPPLYPWLITLAVCSPLGFILTAALLHLLLGLLTVWLTVQVGIRLGLGHASLLAGALVACDPILLHQSSLVMTETLATLLAVCAIGCLIRCGEREEANISANPWIRFALAGSVLALAALCRPTFLLMLPIAGIWLWFQLPKTSGRYSALAAYLLSAALVLAPWIVRNALIFGRPIVATTHGGYTFHLANNPGFYQFLRSGEWGTVWSSTDNFRLHAGTDLVVNMTGYPELRLPAAWAALESSGQLLPTDPAAQELFLDTLHYADASSAIRDEPAMFAYSILVRIGRLWQPLPHAVAETDRTSQLGRYLTALWYFGVYVLALLGFWSLGGQMLRSPWCWPLILVVSFMALQAFYWTDMRMRAPLVPVVCWWAAAGWNCYHRLSSERKA